MHKLIAAKFKKFPSQKETLPESEGAAQPLVVDRISETAVKKPFPWRMLLTLVIGLPAAAIGLVFGGLVLVYLVFGEMDCGGGPVPNSEKAPTATPGAKSAKPISPRS